MGSTPTWVWTNAGMLLAGTFYVWRRLILGTTRGWNRARIFGSAAVAALGLLGTSAVLGQYLLPMSIQNVLGPPCWMAYAFLVFLASLAAVTEPVRLIGWLLGRRSDGPRSDSRRLFFRRVLGLGTLAGAAAVTGVGVSSALGDARVLRYVVRLPKMPAEALGMTITLVSDLHLGSVNKAGFCREVVDWSTPRTAT